MANRKPDRPDADIAALARQWREGSSAYRDGMPIAGFLRSQLQRFETLLATGWSWRDIAKSLDAAQIRYGTGNSWRPEILNAKVWQLQSRSKRQGQAAALVQSNPAEAYQLVKRAVVEALEAKGVGRSPLERQVQAALTGRASEQPGLDFGIGGGAGPSEPAPVPLPASVPTDTAPKIIGLKRSSEPEPENGPVSQGIAEDQNRVDAVLARIRGRTSTEGSGD